MSTPREKSVARTPPPGTELDAVIAATIVTTTHRGSTCQGGIQTLTGGSSLEVGLAGPRSQRFLITTRRGGGRSAGETLVLPYVYGTSVRQGEITSELQISNVIGQSEIPVIAVHAHFSAAGLLEVYRFVTRPSWPEQA